MNFVIAVLFHHECGRWRHKRFLPRRLAVQPPEAVEQQCGPWIRPLLGRKGGLVPDLAMRECCYGDRLHTDEAVLIDCMLGYKMAA